MMSTLLEHPSPAPLPGLAALAVVLAVATRVRRIGRNEAGPVIRRHRRPPASGRLLARSGGAGIARPPSAQVRPEGEAFRRDLRRVGLLLAPVLPVPDPGGACRVPVRERLFPAVGERPDGGARRDGEGRP